ncbi:hypothetical protein PS662_01602 [Pseudomonas fluorescens]|uniref:Anti-sigma factor n=1 Tax=Pseudomonas fluorescens TaxID=294 RepID=A0A5E6RS45_PSEFL|nr:anti-sigma factor [Pseudomonas fluorescens]VVM66988.1 hypothetical protein PS662_01602 [Pseudomonas fluorescens]
MINLPPSDYALNAYIDHQLNDVDRVMLGAWLAGHPDVAYQVKDWQTDAYFLRAALTGNLLRGVNAALDPAFIRTGIRHNRYRRFVMAFVLVIATAVGGMSGWQSRESSITSAVPPMADAVQAYRMFALKDQFSGDWNAGNASNAQQWLDRNFSRAERLPDMELAGFKPVSGRMNSTEQGAAAMIIYKDQKGRTLSFYIRPSGENVRMLPRGSRQDGDLQADYWSSAGYNYAIVGPLHDEAIQRVRRKLRASI